MEYALWVIHNLKFTLMKLGLNPYSNGICSLRVCSTSAPAETVGLNPYSNGICSMRTINYAYEIRESKS